jgi:hypothetical protein
LQCKKKPAEAGSGYWFTDGVDADLRRCRSAIPGHAWVVQYLYQGT